MASTVYETEICAAAVERTRPLATPLAMTTTRNQFIDFSFLGLRLKEVQDAGAPLLKARDHWIMQFETFNFMGLAIIGYEPSYHAIQNLALRVSLIIYRLICNARLWKRY